MPPHEEFMEIDLTLTSEEWYQFQKYVQRKKMKELKGVLDGFGSNLILWGGLTFVFVILFAFIERFHYPTAIFCLVTCATVVGLFFINSHRLQRAFAPSENGTFVGVHRFIFDAQGIHCEGKDYKSSYAWRAVKDIIRANGMIMLFIDTAHAFIFPETQLKDPDGFLSTVSSFRA